MMEIRRSMMGVIAGMASGANFVKGSFTVPNSGASYSVDFGKSFDRYIFLIEADEDARETIIDSGLDASKAFAVIGTHPVLNINNVDVNFGEALARINPATSAVAMGSAKWGTTSSRINVGIAPLTGSTPSALYHGLTYNYYVFEIK